MATYLVTGGAGFIGPHIVRRLVARGEKVRVVDNFLTGSRDNLGDIIDRIELIEGDIRDAELMRKLMKGARYCLHHAALPSVHQSIQDPMTSNEINITGTLNTLLAAKEAKVERFVYASSCAVYGDSQDLPKRENMPAEPFSPYAIGKLAGEKYTRAFYSLYGMPTVCLRYFNIFGPGQSPDSPYAAVIPIFISAMLADRPATVHGDGEQTRDFCYVDNVVSANLLACSAPAERVAGKVFNVASEKSYTINQLVENLNAIIGKEVKPIHTPPRNGDIRESAADISLARQYLGYVPSVGFTEGLDSTVRWFQRNSSSMTT